MPNLAWEGFFADSLGVPGKSPVGNRFYRVLQSSQNATVFTEFAERHGGRSLQFSIHLLCIELSQSIGVGPDSHRFVGAKL